MGTPSQTVPCAPGTTVDELYHGLFGDFADCGYRILRSESRTRFE